MKISIFADNFIRWYVFVYFQYLGRWWLQDKYTDLSDVTGKCWSQVYSIDYVAQTLMRHTQHQALMSVQPHFRKKSIIGFQWGQTEIRVWRDQPRGYFRCKLASLHSGLRCAAGTVSPCFRYNWCGRNFLCCLCLEKVTPDLAAGLYCYQSANGWQYMIHMTFLWWYV